ncbi:hypothetical protein ACFYWS_36025 [Streptomyces sp. NPDC002795]|uniref:hypothetical protein n=1 Tax=Streptomyces sp. NPDC002795 TaxID=3364665 RepID=UPI003683CD2B
MSGTGFDVESAALRRYAQAAEQAADKVESIRRRLAPLDLHQQTFGRLPESDELKADYDKQSEEAATDLKDVQDALTVIAETVRGSADAYDQGEEAQTQSFGGAS